MTLPITGDATKGKSVVTDNFVSKDLSLETEAKLLVATNDINIANLSGKDEGGAIVSKNGTDYSLAIAKGEAADSGWSFIRPIPHGVTQADLADEDSAINTVGKFAGKIIVAVGGTAGFAIYISSGATPTSIWYLPTGIATGAITPA